MSVICVFLSENHQLTDDFEYSIEVSAGKDLVTFPVTSPEINRIVVLMK